MVLSPSGYPCARLGAAANNQCQTVGLKFLSASQAIADGRILGIPCNVGRWPVASLCRILPALAHSDETLLQLSLIHI